MARVTQHTEFLTKQQIFDRVATHLLTQGVVSLDKEGEHCRYRGPHNLQCAIGCLIPDEHYQELFEGTPIGRYLFSKDISNPSLDPLEKTRRIKGAALGKALLYSGINIHDEGIFSLCRTLQYIHDEQGLCSHLLENKALRDTWADLLRIAAFAHNLSADVIDQVLSSLEAQQ